MRVFRRIGFRTSKEDNEAGLLERARDALLQAGVSASSILFHLRDPVLPNRGTPVSGAERIVKRFPQLAEFAFTDPTVKAAPQYRPGQVLSNVPPGWPASNPNGRHEQVELSTLVEVARGIPRAYPVYSSAFVFDRIEGVAAPDVARRRPARPAPRTALAMPARHDLPPMDIWPLDYLSTSITVHGDWGSSQRQIALFATVEVESPADRAASLPPLSYAAPRLIKELGEVVTDGLVGAPSEEDGASLAEARQRARQVVGEAARRIDGRPFEFLGLRGVWLSRPLKGIDLPHDLRPEVIRRAPDEPISPKKALVAAFKPRGYEYLTGRGGPKDYRLRKRATSHNLISLAFGQGQWLKVLMATLRYEGPLWHHDVTLRFSPHQGVHHFIDTPNQEVLEQVVANAAVVVDFLEQTMVPALDGIYGPAPAWFEYGT